MRPGRSYCRSGIFAQIRVEGIGQDYGVDTNDSGSYLYLATDQVRFYRTDAAENWRMPLEVGMQQQRRGRDKTALTSHCP